MKDSINQNISMSPKSLYHTQDPLMGRDPLTQPFEPERVGNGTKDQVRV